MKNFIIAALLLCSGAVNAAVTANYSWTVSYTSNSLGDGMIGKTVVGTLVFDEETAPAGAAVQRYTLTSHTITIDGSTVSNLGAENLNGSHMNSLMVVNNLYNVTLSDAIIAESTANGPYQIDGEGGETLELMTFGIVFSDTDQNTLTSADLTEAAVSADFELSDGRLTLRKNGVDFVVSSQAGLNWSLAPSQSNANAIVCPDWSTPGYENTLYVWSVCDVDVSAATGLTTESIDHIMSIRVPKALDINNQGKIHVFLHPDENGSGIYATDRSSNQAEYDQIEIHPTEYHYGTTPKGSHTGWWVYSGRQIDLASVDNYNGNQISAGIDYVLETWPEKVDINKGIHCRGVSLGGAGCMHQAMILPKYQNKIALIDVIIGRMNIPKLDEVNVDQVWGTSAENAAAYNAVDYRQQYDKIKDIHFSWRGGSNDGLGTFDPDFTTDLCEAKKVSCSVAWLLSGHSIVEPGYTIDMTVFGGDANTDVSLDVILPVITNNTSNYSSADRGYYNRGIGWDYANITETSSTITIPLRYTAMTNIGPLLPDQPNSITFSVTPRHTAAFVMTPGANVDWVFGGQSGTAVVDSEGLVTIDGLALTSGAGYTNLVLTHGSAPIVQNSIVYTKIPATTGTHTVTKDSVDYDIDYADLWDFLPESGRPFYNFRGPGSLVIRTPAGVETVIKDCITPNTPCVPMDPAVSPDGTKIAYALFSSSAFVKAWYDGVTLPQDLLSSTGAEASIHIYDIATQQTTDWPHTPGDRDSGPAWLPDGRIMFTSTRQGYIQPYLPRGIGTGTYGAQAQPRLHIADADGTNVEDIGQHELTQALHPYTLSTGRVLYSSHWMSHNLPYYGNNGSVNWPTTTNNMWALHDVDYKGGDMTVLLGGHRNTFQTAVQGRTKTQKVLHLHGERANGDICVDNYYRTNNFGLGDIFCWSPEPKGVEGEWPSFLPRGIYSAFEWSKSNDEPSFTYGLLGIGDQSNTYLGKVGWPEGTDDGQLMVTVCRGYCTQIGSNIPTVGTTLAGRESASIGIYKTTVIPSLVPEDMEVVVDDPNFHEFGARIIRTRTIATPTLSTTGDSSCELISTDAGTAETSHHPSYPYNFNSNYRTAANNGGEIDGLAHTDVVGIKFFEPVQRPVGSTDPANYTGGLMKVMGTVPLLTDKSFKVKLPCNTPYLMAGVDSDDRVIKRDQLAQSLRTGEKRICQGCHLHSMVGRDYSLSDAFNATAFDLTAAAIAAPTYTADVLPILQSRCQSCHNPADNIDDVDNVPLWTYDGLALDFYQQQVPASMKVIVEPTQTADVRKYGFQRPQFTKYVNTMFARESLLYWKVINQRADGRTDNQYDDDIDFGASHAVPGITQGEIDIIAEWLDTGATE